MPKPNLQPIRRSHKMHLHVEQLEQRLAPTAATVKGTALGAPAFASDHVLVRLRSDLVGHMSLDNSTALPLVAGLYEVKLAPGVTVAQALAAYRNSPWVADAEPDYIIHASALPNDPYFGYQWGLNNTGQTSGRPGDDIGAAAAWNVTTGSGDTVVAEIDSGIDYTHPDLAANIWINPTVNTDGYLGDLHGYNFVNNTGDPMDDFGHGTHVAGIIGAVGNDGFGVTGVAWHVQLMALKFLDSQGNGSTSDAIRAIDFAVSHGATVINASWAGTGYDADLFNAIKAARDHGVIFVAAAGNGDANGNPQNNDYAANYPTNFNLDNIISVAALDSANSLAPFSNYGKNSVDLAAPGMEILSTTPGGQYEYMSGTSMATPYVTGAVVLLHDAHPDWNYHQIIARILSTVDPLPSLEGKTVSGGRLDIGAALALDANSGPRITGLSTFSSVYVNKLRVTFDHPVNPATFTPVDITGFTGPSNQHIPVGYVIPVYGSNNRQFDLYFPLQYQVGTYHLSIGPNVNDLAGHSMNQNGNGINGEATADRFSGTFYVSHNYAFANNSPVAIPDVATAVSSININQNLTVTGVIVRINITHTYDADLYIHLVSPNGTDVVLSNRRGGSGHNYYYTTFDDLGTTPIGSNRAPFYGTFQPEGMLSSFAGQNAKGTWRLYVEDRDRGDVGTLNSWSLTIET